MNDCGATVEETYNFLSYLQTAMVMPLCCTEYWLATGRDTTLAYTHSVLATIPVVLYLTDNRNDELLNFAVGISVISMGVLGVLHENYFATGAAATFGFNHFFLSGSVFDNSDLPLLDVYNFGMCLFCYLTLHTF